MKKISPNLIGFIIALLICVASLWIYFTFLQKKSYHLIDNPGKNSLLVQIDENEYNIAPGQFVQVALSMGEHTISTKIENDTLPLIQRAFVVADKRGLLNPTLSRYYIYGMPYGPKVNKDSIFANLKTEFKGKTYLGDLRIDSAIYTEDFYYNINEEFPAMTLQSENDTLRRKIFREDDFKQFYFKNYE